MGKLIDGDDGLPAEEVGVWAKEKHDYLCRYIDISRSTRAVPDHILREAVAEVAGHFVLPGRAGINQGVGLAGAFDQVIDAKQPLAAVEFEELGMGMIGAEQPG